MFDEWLILLVSLLYVGVLFAVAYYGDRRARAGRSIIANPYIYALSLAVYCTAWTFYGSVGRAASTGVGFLPIYLGPTLMAPLWWVVLRKMVRISKLYRITSIADFIASRYGKSMTLAGVVTVIAVLGIIPYISLQLKAISTSFQIISGDPSLAELPAMSQVPFLEDQTFLIALALAAFTILFGARHLEATERHEGLVAAIAFESIVKLLAFLAVGAFVTFGLYDGFGALFDRAAADPDLRRLFSMGDDTYSYSTWVWYTVLSMMAILFLPRQFHIAVVENVDERHLHKALWLFPLYLLVINVFVLPIAFSGLLHFPGGNVDADTFVLTLPIAEGQGALALFAFIGGLSAATGMVIVAIIALSIMISNDLVMPVLLRQGFLHLSERRDLSGLLLGIRRGSILAVLLMGYVYYRLIAESYPLVSIGLISFAAVAQFGPALLGGIFWKAGTRTGALCGLVGGFIVWAYTLPLPSLVQADLIALSFVTDGPFGITWLRPYSLFGLEGLDFIAHALFWSLLVNAGLYVGISLFTRQSVLEHSQALAFVDVFKHSEALGAARLRRSTASVHDLQALLRRFLGRARADQALTAYTEAQGLDYRQLAEADAELVQYAEQLLAGAIGSASARVVVGTVVKEEPLSMDEVMRILDETQQVIAHSRALEQKSRALERATRELQEANERLQELDRLKDDFVSTVTHELRTPLTSVRALAEILHDHPEVDIEQRQQFLSIIINESERLTRLINQVLDFQKLETDSADWEMEALDLCDVVRDASTALGQLAREKQVRLSLEAPASALPVRGDADRLMQVLVNLLSNAIKFSDGDDGRVLVRLRPDAPEPGMVQIDVADNGPGVPPAAREAVFHKFRQLQSTASGRPAGSGLGLSIARSIVEHHGGRIWVDETPGGGATFSFTLPLAPQPTPVAQTDAA